MKKLWLPVFAATIVTLCLAGCADKSKSTSKTENPDSEQPTKEQPASEHPTEHPKK